MAREGEAAAGVQRQMKVIFQQGGAIIYRRYTESKNGAGWGRAFRTRGKNRARLHPHPSVDSGDRRNRRCTRGSRKPWITWKRSDGSSFRASRASTATGFAGERIPTDGRWPKYSSTFGWWNRALRD